MKKKAFTLIEMLLVIAIIGLLGTITIPFYQRLQITTQRQTFSNQLISELRHAKLMAISANNDQSWGLNINQNQATLFMGNDFANRDQTFDESVVVPSNVTVGGSINQVIFAKQSGLPNVSGIITVSDTNGQTQSIAINSQGTVDY